MLVKTKNVNKARVCAEGTVTYLHHGANDINDKTILYRKNSNIKHKND